ncbi:MAG: hypothetical protein CL943_00360 [Candidatus Diapherotrites archaeon]|uniref:Alpha-galactosidase NEW3 domain-containing protein n=1 Tax=Candidatus Iainarchaeum sp. TaxID=3101447 RepID=A0A2D6M003_9ARCH|nr:hypothetical protein [Candidatus Diapherotrites archaeon]|tara:strand:+ start:1725 stop:3587 length:1863 start_codon:yes stop_codon:yes gene_type:complete
MNKTIVTAIFLLALAAQAFAFGFGVDIYSDTDTVFLNRNDSIGVPLTIENTSNEEQCVELFAETDSPYVEATPTITELCLNKDEKTSVTLNVKTIDAPASAYFTITMAVGDGSSASYTLAVKTVSEPELEIIPFEGDICRGEDDYFSVLVKNNSNELKQIRLWADNEMLLPYFSPDSIVLDSQEEKYVNVVVHAGRHTLLGDYRVSLFAESGSEQAKKVAFVDIKDCEEEEIEFVIEFPTSCQRAEKDEEERVSYSVRNLTDEEIELRVAIESTLPTDYKSRIRLEENEERTFRIDVTPRLDEETGRHDLTLIVWDPETGRTEERTKCVLVNTVASGAVEFLNNNLEIEQGSSDVFILVAKNTGDEEIDFRIDTIENFDTDLIDVSISDSRFDLDEGEQQYVYIAVSTMGTSPLGSFEFDVTVRIDGENVTETLYFNVVETLPERETELEITSFPLQVKVVGGEETSFIASIKNNSEEALENITVQLVGLPNGAFAPSIKNLSLEAGQSRDVQLYISTTDVEEGIYTATIEAKTSEFKVSEEIEFVVEAEAQATGDEPEEDDETGQFISGLFTAGYNTMLGLVTLAIVIALIVLIGKAFSGNATKLEENKNNDRTWLKGA